MGTRGLKGTAVVMTAADAFATCEALAADHTHASAAGPYAEGYRAAAENIVNAIRAKRTGRPRSTLQLELRDAAIEARTLAGVVKAAETVLTDLGGDISGADAMGHLLRMFFASHELPPKLRAPMQPPRSGTRLARAAERRRA
jgi:hypothetical protein